MGEKWVRMSEGEGGGRQINEWSEPARENDQVW
jgi:hypothetical protein